MTFSSIWVASGSTSLCTSACESRHCLFGGSVRLLSGDSRASRAPCRPPHKSLRAPQPPQRPPKDPQEPPMGLQSYPREFQKASRDLPESSQGLLLGHPRSPLLMEPARFKVDMESGVVVQGLSNGPLRIPENPSGSSEIPPKSPPRPPQEPLGSPNAVQRVSKSFQDRRGAPNAHKASPRSPQSPPRIPRGPLFVASLDHLPSLTIHNH